MFGEDAFIGLLIHFAIYFLIFLLAAFWAARSFRARNDPERISLASKEDESVKGVEKEADQEGWCSDISRFMTNPLVFLKNTAEADDDTVLAKAGLESVIYLHILQALLTLFAVLSVIGVLVLLPLNLYTDRKAWVSMDSFLHTTANGFRDPRHDLVVHMLFSLFTAGAMVLVVYLLRDVLVSKCRTQLGPNSVPPVQAYTVELNGLRLDPPVSADELKPLAQAAAPGRLLCVSVALDVADVVDRVENACVLRKRLARLRQQLENDKERPTVRTGPLRWIGLGPQEDAITAVEKEMAEGHKEFEKARVAKGRVGTGTAFITFTKRPAAAAFIEKFADPEKARKAFGHPTIGKGKDFLCSDTGKWRLELAARPEDIYWRNLKCSTMHRVMLNVGGFLSLVFLLAFLVTPIFLVQILLGVGDVVTDVTGGGVASNTTVDEVHQAKGEMEGADLSETLEKAHQGETGLSGWIAIILAFLWPFLIILINSVVMPALVRFMAKRMGERYISMMQRTIFNFLFFFTVLNILIIPSLALEGLGQLLSLTDSHHKVYALLGQVLIFGCGSPFFVDYIAQSALLGSAFFFVYHTTTPTAIFRGKDSADKAHSGWEFDFPSFYSSLLSVLAIGLFFSVTVPLVLPCVLVFVTVRYYTDKWQLQTAHSPERVDPAPESTASAVLVAMLVVTAAALASFASWLSGQEAFFLALWPLLGSVGLLVFVAVPYTRHRFVTISNKWRPTQEFSPDTWETEADPAYADAYDNPYLREDADGAPLGGDGGSDLLSGV